MESKADEAAEDIEARVADAVSEVPRPALEPEPPRDPEPAPLELAERPPPRPSRYPEPPSMTALAVKRALARVFKYALIAAALALAGAGFFAFTDTGRDLLPAALRPAGKEAFYTFTDAEGVVHYVDDLEKVPPKYRARAKKAR